MARENLIGQKFNFLTVLELDEERTNQSKKAYQICKCDCGNTKTVRADSLKSGVIKSCGCYNRKAASERMKTIGSQTKIRDDLTGQQFGYQTVLSRAENQNNHVAQNCKCKCGTEKIVLGQSLKSGASQSCGCLNMSHGELKIEKLLSEANILYKKEFPIQDLQFKRENNKARFDFYVNNSYAIEFDGQQHYQDMSKNNYFKHDIDIIQEHDELKNEYCKKNNIPLIRIPYTHLNDLCLEDLLLETSKFRIV